jgi:uncharacterized membrane protein
MEVLDDKTGNVDPTEGSKDELISILEASVNSLSKEVGGIKDEVRGQRQEGRNIIIGAIIALLFIVVTVAIEVILFHTSNSKDYIDIQYQYSQKLEETKKDFYAKEELGEQLFNNEKNTKILECIKSRGYFSFQCFGD